MTTSQSLQADRAEIPCIKRRASATTTSSDAQGDAPYNGGVSPIALPPALRSRVASIDVIDHAGGEIRVLPSAGAVLGFQLRGGVRAGEQLLAPLGVTGVQTTARNYAYLSGTRSVLVRFKPQGAACLGVPGSELADRSVAIDDLLPSARARAIREQLLNAPDVACAVALVQEVLLSLPYVHDALVARALIMLEASDASAARVAAVARELGLSERQLERRVVLRTGLSPKRYASLRRFERAVSALGVNDGQPLAQIAQAAGYYDQSHFIREFSRLAGVSPGRFVRNGQ